jgi:tRNA pseudouridine38-40 synthase
VPAMRGRPPCGKARKSPVIDLPTFRIVLAYDGTDFVGWQRQASGISIQGLLEDALRELDQRDVAVTGAGRTDAGVHALGQTASFSVNRAIAGDALVRALNARLPHAVRVLSGEEMPSAFHARFDARGKTYRYRIWNGDVLAPFDRCYTWHVPGALDVGAMQAAAQLLEGRHDFAAFKSVGSPTKTTDREVSSSRVTSSESEILYEVTGSGFLRHMVRTIVGTLVEVGRGRRPIDWVADVLKSRDRAAAGPTAPAHGLFLVRVEYN